MSESMAQTVLFYLGGTRFARTVGATDFTESKNHMQFYFNGRPKKANMLRVDLLASGNYYVHALRYGGNVRGNTALASKFDVPADQLRQTFTDLTGVETHV